MFLIFISHKGSNGNSNGVAKEDEIINLTEYGGDSDDSVKSIPIKSMTPVKDKASSSRRSRSRFVCSALYRPNLIYLAFSTIENARSPLRALAFHHRRDLEVHQNDTNAQSRRSQNRSEARRNIESGLDPEVAVIHRHTKEIVMTDDTDADGIQIV